jgi:hypothetical protein
LRLIADVSRVVGYSEFVAKLFAKSFPVYFPEVVRWQDVSFFLWEQYVSDYQEVIR